MPSAKRKPSSLPSSDSSSDEGDFPGVADDLNMFNSLVGPSGLSNGNPSLSDGDSDDEDAIRAMNSKGKIKDGMKFIKKASKGETKSLSGGGSFQSMGLHPLLLKALIVNGYKNPTPIQRLAIPSLLSSPPRDLVGMARTGSGKTLAFMVPLLQRLAGRHSAAFGARALILIPSRELALQIMKVGKELSRAWHKSGASHAGDHDTGHDPNSQALRWSLIIGGESLDGQFDMVAKNPDVIVATPGRLLHLIVEMNLDLKSVQFVVFDEADRLFEMGFATALHEIIQRLPPNRQSLLFSATLPSNLVEFAKAGLQDPKLVRLDVESKVSSDLRMAFFSVKEADKDASLFTLLREVIKVPLASERASSVSQVKPKKRAKPTGPPKQSPHQTLVFCATKHHVEYLYSLLQAAGYAVSHIYGSLDQAARRQQLETFKKGESDILVVTDVAARGVDIPILEHVVNYDFPQGSRVFVHRVGRTARAGRQGWAWSFVTYPELPYLIDLQLFLGKPLQTSVDKNDDEAVYVNNLILGTFPRDSLEEETDRLNNLDAANSHLPTLRQVKTRGHTLYERTKGKASQPSYTKAKDMMKTSKWGLAGSQSEGEALHPIFNFMLPQNRGANQLADETKRLALLKAVNGFTPKETILELGAKGKMTGAVIMKERRKSMAKAAQRRAVVETEGGGDVEMAPESESDEDDEHTSPAVAGPSRTTGKYKDSEFYMSYEQPNAAADKGYSLKEGTSFAQDARNAVMDVGVDEDFAQKARQQKWDRTKKKYVGTGEGADNVKLIRTENGTRLPATYRSGRFDDWRKTSGVRLPRVGEQELGSADAEAGNRFYRHKKVTEAKVLDPKQFGYDRKVRQLKKKQQILGTDREDSQGGAHTKFKTTAMHKAKNELKTADMIRKDRKLKERRRARNARPSKKKRA